jgi:hypothetical protein
MKTKSYCAASQSRSRIPTVNRLDNIREARNAGLVPPPEPVAYIPRRWVVVRPRHRARRIRRTLPQPLDYLDDMLQAEHDMLQVSNPDEYDRLWRAMRAADARALLRRVRRGRAMQQAQGRTQEQTGG